MSETFTNTPVTAGPEQDINQDFLIDKSPTNLIGTVSLFSAKRY